MFGPLDNIAYRTLFTAHLIALLGTGLATIAIALLAFELARDDAGAVLGTALFIKMVAYVGISPFAGVLAGHLPRKSLMIAMDIIRVIVVLFLPFVDQVWQLFVLIFLMQSASALFTPTYQAVIPDVLPDERDYTKALSLSKLTYDLENLLSPAIAALLLMVVSFHWLFIGTSIGFLISALLVFLVKLPGVGGEKDDAERFIDRLTRGGRIFLRTPRLRGLIALNMCVASGGAMVLVNTVVLVRGELQKSDIDVSLALAAYGMGSIAAALMLPRLLDLVSDRLLMVSGGVLTSFLLAAFGFLVNVFTGSMLWAYLLFIWCLLGFGVSLVSTPSGRLVQRSSEPAERPATYAAQFALSHLCWMITYPVAGVLGSAVGMAGISIFLAVMALSGAVSAAALWPMETDADHSTD